MKQYNNAGELCCRLRFASSELSRMFPAGRLDERALKEFENTVGMPNGINPDEAYQWVDSLIEVAITQTYLLGQIEARHTCGDMWNAFVHDMLEDTADTIINVLKRL